MRHGFSIIQGQYDLYSHPQPLAQLLARVKYTCLNGSDRCAGYFGNFHQRMPQVPGKFRSPALFVGKTLEAMHHPVLHFSLPDRIDSAFLIFVKASIV